MTGEGLPIFEKIDFQPKVTGLVMDSSVAPWYDSLKIQKAIVDSMNPVDQKWFSQSLIKNPDRFAFRFTTRRSDDQPTEYIDPSGYFAWGEGLDLTLSKARETIDNLGIDIDPEVGHCSVSYGKVRQEYGRPLFKKGSVKNKEGSGIDTSILMIYDAFNETGERTLPMLTIPFSDEYQEVLDIKNVKVNLKNIMRSEGTGVIEIKWTGQDIIEKPIKSDSIPLAWAYVVEAIRTIRRLPDLKALIEADPSKFKPYIATKLDTIEPGLLKDIIFRTTPENYPDILKNSGFDLSQEELQNLSYMWEKAYEI